MAAHLTMNMTSKALSMPVMLDIIMPQGRGDYKTLYLLHGAGGDRESWLLKSRLADYVDNTDIAVVMPAGNNKCYVNNVNGKNYFDYVAFELPQMMENTFKVSKDRKNKFIGGMSMGGYGAMYAALKTDAYAAAFSFSGLLDIYERYENPRGIDMAPVFGTKEQLLAGDFNLFDLLTNYKKKDSYTQNILDIHKKNVDNSLKIYISSGNVDKMTPMSTRFFEKAKALGFDIQYMELPGGHDWNVWDASIKKAVEIIKGEDVLWQ